MLDPTTHMVAIAINVILAGIYNAYIFTSVAMSIFQALGRQRPRLMNLIWFWTKWPGLVYLITDPVFAVLIEGKLGWLRAFFDILGLWVWWGNKDQGDDEDHKKLKNKLKEKVTQMRGKLVVVPVPA